LPDDARVIVERYLDDINDQDRAHAQTLICPELAGTWRTTIDQPGGDFTVTITGRTFERSTLRSEGIDLVYSLDVRSRTTGRTGVSPVTFTVIDRRGDLLICGERQA